jgi:CPA2 family monovalent cation:H+ antiporter-2
VITVIALIPLVAVWRNIAVMTMIYAESVSHARLPLNLVRNVLQSFAAVALAFWIYAIIPLDQLSGWGWLVIGLFAVLVITVYSRKLVFWYSEWNASVRSVLADGGDDSNGGARGRILREQGLQDWDVKLSECVVPDSAAYAGQSLAQLAIPTRFGCVLLELERNGIVITNVGPDLRVYPGDKLLLMGEREQIEAACEALSRERHTRNDAEAFRGSVLETLEIPDGPWSGRTLAELNIGQLTGTRIVGVHRSDQRIIAPSGQEKLHAGDNVLVAGTLTEIASFRRWLKNTPAQA